jgi:hypothetical protein
LRSVLRFGLLVERAFGEGVDSLAATASVEDTPGELRCTAGLAAGATACLLGGVWPTLVIGGKLSAQTSDSKQTRRIREALMDGSNGLSGI